MTLVFLPFALETLLLPREESGRCLCPAARGKQALRQGISVEAKIAMTIQKKKHRGNTQKKVKPTVLITTLDKALALEYGVSALVACPMHEAQQGLIMPMMQSPKGSVTRRPQRAVSLRDYCGKPQAISPPLPPTELLWDFALDAAPLHSGSLATKKAACSCSERAAFGLSLATPYRRSVRSRRVRPWGGLRPHRRLLPGSRW